MAFSLSSIQFLPPLSSSSSSSLQIKNPNFFPKFPRFQFPNLPKHSFTLTHTSSTPPPPITFTNDDVSQPPSPPPPPQTAGEQPPPSTKTTPSSGGFPPPLLKKRKRYRKEYPGESKGITEEMRFVAMKLKNSNRSRLRRLKADSQPSDDDDDEIDGGDVVVVDDDDDDDDDESGWVPSLEGFLKYLVDSKLVFDTIERVVEDSNDVSYAYFRRSGLERSESLASDIEWFREQNISIPEPSNPGISYTTYLTELSEKSAPLFLAHFYNIYFSHIAGGQVITKQVVEKLLVEKELNFYKWDKDSEELLKDVREKLNRLSEHWSREDKNKCLKETTKSFRYMGQIVRLIIL